MPKVSILIPAYNIGDCIERCLDSAVNQTLQDIEIIVVNDGSTDNTPEIIDSFAKKDKRIIVISQENSGLSVARNVAIKRSASKYILHLDGDDWIELNACEVLFERAEDEDADIIVFNSFCNDENGYQFKIDKEPLVSGDNITFIKNILINKIKPCVIRRFFRRSLYIDNNIWHPEDIGLGEDLTTIVPLAFYTKKIIGIDNYLYHYYSRSESITKKYSIKMLEIFKAVDSVISFLNTKGYKEKFKDEIVYFQFFFIILHYVVLFKTDSPIKKEIWCKWKSLNVNFIRNKYFKDYIKNKSLYLKLRILVFNYNYFCGNFLSILQR